MLDRLLSRSCVSSGQAAEDVCRTVCEALGVPAAYVTRIDGRHIEVVAVHDPHGLGLTVGTRVLLEDTFCGRVLDGAAPAWCSDLADSAHADIPLRAALGVTSYAMVPLQDSQGRTFGTLCLVDRRRVDRDPAGERLLALLGGLLAREQELERVQQLEAAVRQALTRRAAELAESEARYRSVVDEMRDIIVRVGNDGAVEFVNQAWTELTGIPTEQVLGRGCFEQVHPEDRPLAAEHLQALAAGTDTVPREVRFLAADGSYRWMAVKGRSICDADGALVGFAGMLEDVTERRRAEELVRDALAQAERARDEAQRALEQSERASQAKSVFLSRMSHELRTPLNAILGFGQLLELGDLTGEDVENVEQILNAGRHLLDLINEVLDVVRVESGTVSFSLEPVGVGEVVGESLDLVRVAAAARRVTLDAPARRSAAVTVADRQRLKQILVNLLSNAVKYNVDGGSVTVSCQALPDADAPADLDRPEHGWLRLAVTDTGRGIEADLLDRVFTPFERLGAENTDIEGSGVGLSLTKTLVEALGGRIGLVSSVGQGSTFWVDLPAASPPPVEEPAPATGTAPTPLATVLYVEDNPSNILLVQRVLARRPQLHLVVVRDGAEGLAAARRLRPDLVLLDLHLPSMNGDDVLAAIRSDDSPAVREVPVAVVTADLSAGNERRMLDAGATLFLPKPIDVRRLLAVVDDHLPEP